ncbi:hypothetical protein, partial [Escherichia coli]|uniref:hypothetical protein n=1 Tax=Escherichia coli TaxID=562 RepID=UPI0028786CE4
KTAVQLPQPKTATAKQNALCLKHQEINMRQTFIQAPFFSKRKINQVAHVSNHSFLARYQKTNHKFQTTG